MVTCTPKVEVLSSSEGYPLSQVKWILEQEWGWFPSSTRFYQGWLPAALIEAKPRYSDRDLAKLRFVYWYLYEFGDRSYDRASTALQQALVEHPENFPIEDTGEPTDGNDPRRAATG